MTHTHTNTAITTLTILLALLLATLACTNTPPPPTPTPIPPTPSPIPIPTASPTPTPIPITQRRPSTTQPTTTITPFTNIAPQALGSNANIENDLPGVAILDYDRDNDPDIYITQSTGNPNLLFRNDGNNQFTEIAQQANAQITQTNSTGVVACDINNDGYQDLYISAQGIVGDNLNFQSADQNPTLKATISDKLLLNNTDGTFTDITNSAFNNNPNLRTGTSPACADIDRDGWLDIFVPNRSDLDNIHPGSNTIGNLNTLYHNNQNLTFTDISHQAGITGEQVVSWATLLFDLDNDGDPDLLTADDGGPLRIYRNDTQNNQIQFTSIERPMGLDINGNWMGFALGDYDNDTDLDIFVTNIGYHPITRPLALGGTEGDCTAQQHLTLSTCEHYLLNNNGTTTTPRLGEIPFFPNVADSLNITPSTLMPPLSTDPLKIQREWHIPTGLAAYDFGFGAAFLDYDNDGDQDLYWTGSALGRGESPNGKIFPAAGRMLQNNGNNHFQDITVEAHLLNIKNVDYSILDPRNPQFDPTAQRIHTSFHENGKGLAKADLNNDGSIDLIATNSAGLIFTGSNDQTRHEKGPTFLWINGGNNNNWLKIHLKGRMAIDNTGSNADAIGARAFLTTINPTTQQPSTQIAEITASSSFLSMNSLNLHFGLGKATHAHELTIFWPSGIRQVIANIPANQTLTITEPPAPQ